MLFPLKSIVWIVELSAIYSARAIAPEKKWTKQNLYPSYHENEQLRVVIIQGVKWLTNGFRYIFKIFRINIKFQEIQHQNKICLHCISKKSKNQNKIPIYFQEDHAHIKNLNIGNKFPVPVSKLNFSKISRISSIKIKYPNISWNSRIKRH